MNEKPQVTTALAIAVNDFDQAKRAVQPGDFSAMGRIMSAEKRLKERGRIPIAFIDMTNSMSDDMSRVRPLIKKLEEMGVPVFAFGDAAVGEHVLEVGVNGYLDGAGNGAETPFAALTSALMFLGRPVPGLESKEAIVKALFGEPNAKGEYDVLAGGFVYGERTDMGPLQRVKYTLDERVRWSFADVEKKMDTPDLNAVKKLIKMGLPIDALIITDELGGININSNFSSHLRRFVEAAGGDFSEFLNQHQKTLIGERYDWLGKLNALNDMKVRVTTITPESNFLQDYGKRGLKYLYAYWQGFAAMFGGTAVKLEQEGVDYKIEALINAGKMAEQSIRLLTENLRLLTVGD